MNLDELQSTQHRERRTDSLQQLRDSFYRDVGEYIAELKAERDRAADEADEPFSDPEVQQLTDEIESAKEVVEAIYERRMGKLVKHASLVAAGMDADEEGMTDEERTLFRDIVDRIERNKSTVLDVLEGDDVDIATQDAGGTDDSGMSPAAVMGGEAEPPRDESTEASRADSGETPRGATATKSGKGPADSRPDDADDTGPGPTTGRETSAPNETDAAEVTDVAAEEHADSPDGVDRKDEEDDRPAEESDTVTDGSGTVAEDSSERDAEQRTKTAGSADDRLTVRITDDVGEILGVDERSYDLCEEDVVVLPKQNAEPLVERDAAERLD